MVCCVTGHRPKGFPFPYDYRGIEYMLYFNTLFCEIENLIKQGYRHFITGMADGADIDFAKCILYWKNKENITLEAALPYPITTQKKPTNHIEIRNKILVECDKISVISPYYHNGCMQKRNQYMVDKSDIVLAIWNNSCKGGTWNTIKYARSKGKSIRYIMLNENLFNQ